MIFLDHIKKHTSGSYHASCENHVAIILSSLGNYRLNELRPLTIQNFIDSLHNRTYTKSKVKAKGILKRRVNDRNLSPSKLAQISDLSHRTISNAIKCQTVALPSAEKIANALQQPIESLFLIKNETRSYSSESLAKTVSVLKHMLSLAKRFEITEKNYATSEYVKGIVAVSEGKEIMDLDDALDTLECLQDEENIRAVTAVMIAIYMGRRRGEIAGLRWTDLDLENGIMDVKRSRTPIARKGVVEKAPKTEHSARAYTMPQTLTNHLIKYKQWWDDYIENTLGDRYQGLPYLFLQASGKPMHPSTIYSWWKGLQEKYSLKSVDFHSLRTTNISVQYASNLISSEMIADRAGHANDKITKQKYRKVFQSDDKRAADIVDTIFTRQNAMQ